MSDKIVMLTLLLVISTVFYFSWLPDPSLRSETYLPQWLLKWSNYYYNLRTAVPFIVIGFLLQSYAYYKRANGFYQAKKKTFIKNVFIALIIVCIAEGGQFLIHKRSPDLMDVFYGVLGSIIGVISYNILKKIRNAKQT